MPTAPPKGIMCSLFEFFSLAGDFFAKQAVCGLILAKKHLYESIQVFSAAADDKPLLKGAITVTCSSGVLGSSEGAEGTVHVNGKHTITISETSAAMGNRLYMAGLISICGRSLSRGAGFAQQGESLRIFQLGKH